MRRKPSPKQSTRRGDLPLGEQHIPRGDTEGASGEPLAHRQLTGEAACTFSWAVVLQLEPAPESPGGPVRTQIAGPCPPSLIP